MKVLDWVRARARHPGYLDGGGPHLTRLGVRAFVALCRPYLALARPPRPVRRLTERVRRAPSLG